MTVDERRTQFMTVDERRTQLLNYRGAVSAAMGAARSADEVLRNSTLPETFRNARSYMTYGRLADVFLDELTRIDAILDFIDGTDRNASK